MFSICVCVVDAYAIATAAKSLHLCPTLCDPIDSSPPGSPSPGILWARTLEWVAISFSNAWKWKVKVKSLSCVRLLATPWTAAHQAPPSMGFSRQESWSGVPLPSPQMHIYICIHTHTHAVYAQLCLTLHDSMDSSPPGSSVLGIFRAKNTGEGCIFYSRGSARPMDWICVSWVSCIGRRILYHYHHLGCLMQSVGTDLCFKKVSHCLSEVHM